MCQAGAASLAAGFTFVAPRELCPLDGAAGRCLAPPAMGREEREGRGGDGTGAQRKDGGAEAYARFKQYDYKAVRVLPTLRLGVSLPDRRWR